MKRMALILSLVLAAPVMASTWEIDSAHAAARFSVRHLMISDVTGTLGKVTGTVELDEKDITRSKVDISIAVDPQTQEPKRDEHLKSADFFDAAKYPNVTFKSKKIEKAGGDKLKVTGDLTIRDVTKEVTLDATMIPEVTNPFSKKPTRGVIATGTIANREDFGLKWNVALANNGILVGKEVKIEFTSELTPKMPAAQVKAPAAAPAAPAKK